MQDKATWPTPKRLGCSAFHTKHSCTSMKEKPSCHLRQLPLAIHHLIVQAKTKCHLCMKRVNFDFNQKLTMHRLN